MPVGLKGVDTPASLCTKRKNIKIKLSSFYSESCRCQSQPQQDAGLGCFGFSCGPAFFFLHISFISGDFVPNEILFACGSLTVCHSGLGCPPQLAQSPSVSANGWKGHPYACVL